MNDAELAEKFAEIDAEVDELFALFGKLSKRRAAMGPSYLRDPGEDQVETKGGLQIE